MILKIIVITDLILLCLILLFMAGTALSPKLRANEVSPALNENRKDYSAARTTLTITIPWLMMGTLTRMAGVATSKPGLEVPLYVVDVLVATTILVTLLWSSYCIYYNARLRMKSCS